MTTSMVLAEVAPKDLIGLVAVSTGMLIAIVWIVMTSVRSMVRATAVEKTKREIAAYVAEGTIKPEDAERIINAGHAPDADLDDAKPKSKRGC
jgi:uncharacterized membrane protein YcjF (UPF0283 family)